MQSAADAEIIFQLHNNILSYQRLEKGVEEHRKARVACVLQVITDDDSVKDGPLTKI